MTRSAILLLLISLASARYLADWDSLDQRPLPSWYDEAKFGIFIHWGVYAVPAWGTTGGAAGEWYQLHLDGYQNEDYVDFHEQTFGRTFPYKDFAPMFRAEMFYPMDWATLFKRAGAQYVVLTSKHHDGWANWGSEHSDPSWKSTTAGPKRDIVEELSAAVRNLDMKFGLYYSLYEFFNPLFLEDKGTGFVNRTYIDRVMLPHIKELIHKFEPDILWADGDWDSDSTYWTSKEFLAWLYNDSPVSNVVVTNDRWGRDANCRHGDFVTCMDRFHPGQLITKKWENCFTIDVTSWGYNRNADISAFLSTAEILTSLVRTVAYGGNMLLNVGPESDGRIPFLLQERLNQIGAWMDVNKEAIFGSRPWEWQEDAGGSVFYTLGKSGHVYACMIRWPANSVLTLSHMKNRNIKSLRMLGYERPIGMEETEEGLNLKISLPDILSLPSTINWVFEIQF